MRHASDALLTGNRHDLADAHWLTDPKRSPRRKRPLRVFSIRDALSPRSRS